MPSRRSDITMTAAEIDAFLDEQRVLNVATIAATGHPHLVAMWYAFRDAEVVFWTFGKSQKVVNLRRDPKMTGLVEAGETYDELRGVELVGAARLVENYDEILEIGKLVAMRNIGEDAVSAAALPYLEAQAKKRVGVVFDVERTVSWDHAKLGGAY